uniref:5'-nucleotidase n=1 Tax=Pavo cristatus TaxID=9049 RepID=A0A8C9G239_PAVCR
VCPLRRGARGMAHGSAALCLCLWLSAAAGLRLTLLHTNDVHAHVEERGCAEGPRGCFGGVARRAARVAAERAAQRNVLLLDAGDQYQGTVWFSRFKGQEAVHFMNLLRYDAMVKRSSVGLPSLPGGPGHYDQDENPYLWNDVIFEDEIEALQVQVNKLTAMGVNKIIALGHSGFTVDKNIAQKVKGVDVVIGGHTNTFLYTGILLHAEMFFF